MARSSSSSSSDESHDVAKTHKKKSVGRRAANKAILGLAQLVGSSNSSPVDAQQSRSGGDHGNAGRVSEASPLLSSGTKSGRKKSTKDVPVTVPPGTTTSGPSILPSHTRRKRRSQNGDDSNTLNGKSDGPNPKTRGIVWSLLTLLFVTLLVAVFWFQDWIPDDYRPWFGILPRDPNAAALMILDRAPVIDGHIDLPILTRYQFLNNVTAIDMESEMPAHVDIPRLRKGKVGGFFWSVYVSCADPEEEGKDFIKGTWRVRDTLEQIDVARLLIEKYPDTFQFALGSEDIKNAITNGKIASLLGVEGGHQLGNSLAVLRQYHSLGVRYVTLTHTCHNAFADSCGFNPGIIPLHHGLSSFGRTLVHEMNRLGVLVDLSHTSDETAEQALKHSKAPVIWSHSSARAIHDVPRNVPDRILRLIGQEEGKTDAVVMVNFAPFFVAKPGKANVATVADHVEHIAKIAGKAHVGIGSDYDGIDSVPVGLEDVSKYPALIAELYERGWDRYELAGLTGGNLLRVFEGAERVARELQKVGTQPAFDLYFKRPDLPMEGVVNISI